MKIDRLVTSNSSFASDSSKDLHKVCDVNENYAFKIYPLCVFGGNIEAKRKIYLVFFHEL